jgi:hypothetical protein
MTATIELLYFDGCPGVAGTRAMVERVAAERGARVVLVDVRRTPGAIEQGFLGSPTVLVDGRDIDPSAPEPSGSDLCCRVYRDADGTRTEPREEWLVSALELRPS